MSFRIMPIAPGATIALSQDIVQDGITSFKPACNTQTLLKPREEQTEDRFHRFGQQNNVSITYMITSGTIDEYFTELVEIKRARVAATMDNKDIEWNQQSLMRELAEVLTTRGQNAWRL